MYCSVMDGGFHRLLIIYIILYYYVGVHYPMYVCVVFFNLSDWFMLFFESFSFVAFA